MAIAHFVNIILRVVLSIVTPGVIIMKMEVIANGGRLTSLTRLATVDFDKAALDGVKFCNTT
jgi:hypothetical protein